VINKSAPTATKGVGDTNGSIINSIGLTYRPMVG